MLSKTVNKHSIKIFAFRLGDILSLVFIRANELSMYDSLNEQKALKRTLAAVEYHSLLAGEPERLLISPGA